MHHLTTEKAKLQEPDYKYQIPANRCATGHIEPEALDD